MDQYTIKTVSKVALMPGVFHIDILPNADQVWFSVGGEENTKAVAERLEELFSTKGSFSDEKCWGEDGKLYFTLYPEGLIISITGEKKKAPIAVGAEEKSTFLNSTTEMVEREA